MYKLKKLLIYITILLISSSCFFIRGDWPFGFNGSYLTIFGVLFLLIYAIVIMFYQTKIKIGYLFLSFFLWITISIITLTVSGIITGNVRVSFTLISELSFILLLFFSGYYLVRYIKIPVYVVIWLSSVWVIIASIQFLDTLLAQDAIRRIKALPSVNYMSASFTVFFVTSLCSLLFYNIEYVFFRIYLFIIALLSLVGLLFSASRASFLGLFFVTFIYFAYTLIMCSINLKEKKNSIFVIFAVSFCFFFVFILLIINTTPFDLTHYYERFSLSALQTVAHTRINLIINSLPNSFLEIFLGQPASYNIFPDGNIHPHNIFVSVFSFIGLPSFVFLIVFYFAVIAHYIAHLNIRKNYEDDISKNIIFLIFIILSTYALLSGKFTRHWHLYFVMGLLAGQLELYSLKYVLKLNKN